MPQTTKYIIVSSLLSSFPHWNIIGPNPILHNCILHYNYVDFVASYSIVGFSVKRQITANRVYMIENSETRNCIDSNFKLNSVRLRLYQYESKVKSSQIITLPSLIRQRVE